MTLAITNHNRTSLLFESYSKVIDDSRISEIIIVDDCSDPDIYEQVKAEVSKHPKIKLFRNEINLGMLANKRRAIELSSSELVISFDSDNVIDHRYLDAIPKELHSDTIYCPSFAEPAFDYRQYEGQTFDKSNTGKLMDEKMFRCLTNTANYLVNRDAYLKAWEPNPEIKGSDTIFFNYTWLRKGGKLYVVPGMHYQHRMHEGSGWLQHHQYNVKQAEKTIKLIKAL